LLAPISREQFVDSVRANVAAWDDLADWADWANGRQRQAYAILLLCRALRATTHGDQLSKPAAGCWAQHELPEWADLIARAIGWRKAPKTAAETAPDARADSEFRRFVEDVRRRIIGQ
jgi:hypothetical protein